MKQDNPEYEKLEKDIKESIEKIKKNDEKVWPEKKYLKIAQRGSMKEETEARLKKKKKRTFWTGCIAVCLLLVIITSLIFQHIIFKKSEEFNPVVQPVVAENGCQVINDIEFKILDYYMEDEKLFLKLKVKNKSKNDLYTTVRSMYLLDKDGKEYLPNMKMGKIPINFFGKKITPGSEESALIVFDKFPDIKDKVTLVISNVSDAYHFVWDYLITLSL